MASRDESKDSSQAIPNVAGRSAEIPRAELVGHLRDVVVAAKCIATLVEHLASEIDRIKKATQNKEEVKGC